MPATASKKNAAAKSGHKAREVPGLAALDGLEISLDDAQKAIAGLRGDLTTGGRRLAKDLETVLKSARRDLVRTRKAIQHDLGDLGGALTPRRVDHKPAKPAAKRTAPRAAGRARASG